MVLTFPLRYRVGGGLSTMIMTNSEEILKIGRLAVVPRPSQKKTLDSMLQGFLKVEAHTPHRYRSERQQYGRRKLFRP